MIKKSGGNLVSFRLSKEKHALYEIEAVKRKVSLGVYLKQKLENDEGATHSPSPMQRPEGDELARVIPLMQKSIEFIQQNDRDTNSYRGMMLEILLLLRCTIQPHKVNMVQAEIKRQGLEAWNPKSWEGG